MAKRRVEIDGVAFEVEMIPTRQVKRGHTVSPLTDELRGALLRGDAIDWADAWANVVEVKEHPEHNTGDWSSIITDGHREMFPLTDGAVVRWRMLLEE